MLQGGLDAETFYVGKWEPDVRLCYLRRSSDDEVYAIPCTRPDVFDPDPDGWRNPVIVSVPRSEIAEIEFIYPDEHFSLINLDGTNWIVEDENGLGAPADRAIVDFILSIAEQRLIATGFASDEEANGLKFDNPKAAVRLVTRRESGFPTVRLRFLERDDISYYVNTPADSTVFIFNKGLGDALLVSQADVTQ